MIYNIHIYSNIRGKFTNIRIYSQLDFLIFVLSPRDLRAPITSVGGVSSWSWFSRSLRIMLGLRIFLLLPTVSAGPSVSSRLGASSSTPFVSGAPPRPLCVAVEMSAILLPSRCVVTLSQRSDWDLSLKHIEMYYSTI